MRYTRNTGTMMKMKIQENKQIEVSRFSGLSGYRDISHFTTTRHGGVSTGTYASMNPGVYTEDDPGFIRKNLELLSDAVGISLENMVIPHQTHEDRVLAIDASFLSLNDKERKLRGRFGDECSGCMCSRIYGGLCPCLVICAGS